MAPEREFNPDFQYGKGDVDNFDAVRFWSKLDGFGFVAENRKDDEEEEPEPVTQPRVSFSSIMNEVTGTQRRPQQQRAPPNRRPEEGRETQSRRRRREEDDAYDPMNPHAGQRRRLNTQYATSASHVLADAHNQDTCRRCTRYRACDAHIKPYLAHTSVSLCKGNHVRMYVYWEVKDPGNDRGTWSFKMRDFTVGDESDWANAHRDCNPNKQARLQVLAECVIQDFKKMNEAGQGMRWSEKKIHKAICGLEVAWSTGEKRMRERRGREERKERERRGREERRKRAREAEEQRVRLERDAKEKQEMEEKRRVESEQIQKVLDGLAAREAAAEAEAEEQRRKHALDQERVAEDEKKASEKASSSSSTPTSSEATSEPDNGIHSVEAPAANTPDATTGTPAISTDSSASQRPTSSPPTSPSRKRKSSSSSASSRSSKRVRFTPEVEALPETRKSRLRSWVHTPAASDDDDSLATETIVRAETETVEVATKAVTVVEGNVEVKTEAQGSSVPSVEQVTVAEASDSQAVTTETSSVVSEEGEERVLEDYEEESGSEAVGEQHPQVEFDAPSPPAFPPPPESPAISSDGEPMSPPDLSDSGDQDEQEDLDPEAELTKPLPKMHGFGTSEDINTKGSQASEFNSEAGSRRSSVSYGSLFGDEDEGVECESARDTSSEGEEEPQTPGSSHERVEGKEMTGVKVQVHEVEDEVDFGGGDEEEEE